MATVTLRDTGEVLTDVPAISKFLAKHGIWFRRYDGPELSENASDAEVLEAYEGPVSELMSDGGYRSADVVSITPELPGLDQMLARFDKEHTHAENEVRFLVGGRGMFQIHGDNGQVFSVEVVAGDMINVPKGARHWFHVCEARRCRAIRLYEDMAGWTPHYTGSGVDAMHPPTWQPRARSAGA